MKVVKKKGRSIHFYGSIYELPAERYNKLHQLVLLDFGVGSDMDAVSRHFNQLCEYLSQEKNELAKKEMRNIMAGYFNIINGIDPRSMCLAAFVDKIDSKSFYSLTDDTCKEISDTINKLLTRKDIDFILTELKKKLMMNLEFSSLVDTQIQELLT